MGAFLEARLMLTRAMGTERWNKILLNWGWKKFKKKSPELAILVQNNSQFKNIHKGQRCFVVGNGPSLKEQDLSLLQDEYVFTCNQIMRNPSFPKMKSNYHFFADPSFFQLKKDNSSDMEVYHLMQKINTDNNRPKVFFAVEGYDFSKEFKLNKYLDLNFFSHRLELTEKFDLEFDFSRFVPNLHSVVMYEIIMAIYMGFSEIYLLGCDCTSIITAVNMILHEGEGAEYGYKMTENEKERLKKRNSNILMEDELRSFSEVFRAYRIFYEYTKKRGVKLVNCTEGGLLDCIPREKYEDVI